MLEPQDFIVDTLGKCKIPSPLELSKKIGDGIFNYIDDDERVFGDAHLVDGVVPILGSDEIAGFLVVGWEGHGHSP